MNLNKELWKGRNCEPIREIISLFLFCISLAIAFNWLAMEPLLTTGVSPFTIFMYFFVLSFVLASYYLFYRIMLKDKFKMRYIVTLEQIIITHHKKSKAISKGRDSFGPKKLIIKKVDINLVQKIVVRRTIHGFRFEFYDETSEIVTFECVKHYLSLVKVLKGILNINMVITDTEVIFQRAN